MLNLNPTLAGLIKVHQIPTKPVPISPNNTNFQEFRNIYCERNRVKCSRNRPVSVRPKKDLKTIQLEMPMLGSEKAIISIPVLKKNVIKKSVLKKEPTNVQKIYTAHELVKKLSRMEKEQPKLEKEQSKTTESTTKELKSPSLNFIEKTNRDIDISAVQLQQIQDLIKKKQQPAQRLNKSPVYKMKKRSSPRIRHYECFNSKFRSTLSSLQQKVKYLENKYFSKPQIVYKSIHDNFTQSSDIKILYENKAYPEDMKMDQALRGIIDELDDMVKGNIEEKLLGTTNYDSGLLTSVVKNDETKEFKIVQEKFSIDSLCEQASNNDKKKFSNLDNLFKFGRKFTLGKFSTSNETKDEVNNLPDENENSPKRDYVSNDSSRTSEDSVATSLGNTKVVVGKLNQRTKKKVTFVDTILEETPPISLLENFSRNEKSNLAQEKCECEGIVEKMYKASLSSLGQPTARQDSIFSLLDDTKMQLDEFLKLKHDEKQRVENGKFLFQNTINDMEDFVKTKQRFDQRKKIADERDTETQEIIGRIKRTQAESRSSSGAVGESTKNLLLGYSTPNQLASGEINAPIHKDICEIIDDSEAVVRKYSNYKSNMLSVGEFCENLSKIAESEGEEDDDKPVERPFSLHDGSGDEKDSLEMDEDDLPSSIKRSSFLMKEFNLLPKVNIFSHSESAVSAKGKNRDEVYTSSNKSGLDMRSLKRDVNYALENSIFSTLEY